MYAHCTTVRHGVRLKTYRAKYFAHNPYNLSLRFKLTFQLIRGKLCKLPVTLPVVFLPSRARFKLKVYLQISCKCYTRSYRIPREWHFAIHVPVSNIFPENCNSADELQNSTKSVQHLVAFYTIYTRFCIRVPETGVRDSNSESELQCHEVDTV